MDRSANPRAGRRFTRGVPRSVADWKRMLRPGARTSAAGSPRPVARRAPPAERNDATRAAAERRKTRRRVLFVLIGVTLVLVVLVLVIVASLANYNPDDQRAESSTRAHNATTPFNTTTGTTNTATTTTTTTSTLKTTVTIVPIFLPETANYACSTSVIVDPTKPFAGCYHIYFKTLTWHDAQDACVLAGEQFAVFDSEANDTLIRKHLMKYEDDEKTKPCFVNDVVHYLAGGKTLIKQPTSPWVWMPVPAGLAKLFKYTNWADGQPDQTSTELKFLELASNLIKDKNPDRYFWGSCPCENIKYCYICQVL